MRSTGHTQPRLGLEHLEGRLLPSTTPMAFVHQARSPHAHEQQRQYHDAPASGYTAWGGQPVQDRDAYPDDHATIDRGQQAGYHKYGRVIVVYYYVSPGYVGYDGGDAGSAFGQREGPHGTRQGEGPLQEHGADDRPQNADGAPATAPRPGRGPGALIPDGALLGRTGLQGPPAVNEPAPGPRPAPLPLAQQGPTIAERHLAETRPGASSGAALADLTRDIPLTLGRGDFTPTPRPRNVGAELEAQVQERAAEASAVPIEPKATEPSRAPLPAEGAGLLTEGLPIGLAALERALRALTESEPLSAGRAMSLLHWVGVSTWVMAAAVAYYLVGRRRERPAVDLLREDYYL